MRLPVLIRGIAYGIRRHPGLARAVLSLVPNVLCKIDVPPVGRMYAKLRTNRWLWLRKAEETERAPWEMLKALLDPGATALDCGANIGLYSRYLVSVLGCARVHAFEPDPENLSLLARNLRLGGIENRVTVWPAAVGDVDGWQEFQIDDVQSASGTLSRASRGGPSEGRRNLGLRPLTRTVQCVSLDRLAAEGRISPPDVIKVDVEGAEDLLLEGARGLLERERPNLVIELHGAPVAREVLTSLLDLRYACVGEVAESLDPSRRVRLGLELRDRICGPNDLKFVAASVNEKRLASLMREGT